MLLIVKFFVLCTAIQLVAPKKSDERVPSMDNKEDVVLAERPFGFTGELGPKMGFTFDEDGKVHLAVNNVKLDMSNAKLIKETRKVKIVEPVELEGENRITVEKRTGHVMHVDFDLDHLKGLKTEKDKEDFKKQLTWFNTKLMNMLASLHHHNITITGSRQGLAYKERQAQKETGKK